MGLALPPRRCTDFAVLGLEVFRWSASSAWSEDHAPSPSLSSGATPEFHHSRQSLDPRVRPPRRPTLSDPHLREVTDGCLLPGSCTAGKPAMTGALVTGPTRNRKVTSEKVAPARIAEPRSRCEPEGSRQTAPRRCHQPKPESIAAGLLGPRWQAIVAVERPAVWNLSETHTRAPWPIAVCADRQPAANRKVVGDRVSGPAPTSRLRFREPTHERPPVSVTAVRRSQTPEATSEPAMDHFV